MSSLPPPGFRFRPTNQELLFILKKKILGDDLPSPHIQDNKKLYGDDNSLPWVLFNDNDAWETTDDVDYASKKKQKQFLYCSTRLTKVSRNATSKNCNRSCGRGLWHAETGEQLSCDDRLITKLFKFKIKNGQEMSSDEDAQRYSWLMHEYSLSKKSLQEMNIGSTDLVLCKITRQEEKICPRKQSYSHVVVQEGGLRVPGGCLGKRIYPNDVSMEQQYQSSKVARYEQHSVNDEPGIQKNASELEDMLMTDEEDTSQVHVEGGLRSSMENASTEDGVVVDLEAVDNISTKGELDTKKLASELEDMLIVDEEENPSQVQAVEGGVKSSVKDVSVEDDDDIDFSKALDDIPIPDGVENLEYDELLEDLLD